jgi:DNA-binding response OmpR family regulator
MAKILVIDDDAALARSIKDFLEFEHHAVDTVFDADAAWEHLQAFGYDVVILDWQLPGGASGVDICKRYRAQGGASPVLMLTGMSQTGNKIQGLDAGADDYVTKPVEIPELVARVRAMLRRPAAFSGDMLKAGQLELNTRTRICKKNGSEIKLKPVEYNVLEFLLRHPNEVISAESLLRQVWDSDSDSSLDAVYTVVTRLRKKLQDSDKDAEIIKTVHGVGYRLVRDE